jgi:hypothetical protein
MENLDAKMSDVMGPVADALKTEGLARCIYPYWEKPGVARCDLYIGSLDQTTLERFINVCKTTGSKLEISVDTVRVQLRVSLTRSACL